MTSLPGYTRDVIDNEFYRLSVIHHFGVDIADISVIRYIRKRDRFNIKKHFLCLEITKKRYAVIYCVKDHSSASNVNI